MRKYPQAINGWWLAVAIGEAALVSQRGGTGYGVLATIIDIGSFLLLGLFMTLRKC